MASIRNPPCSRAVAAVVIAALVNLAAAPGSSSARSPPQTGDAPAFDARGAARLAEPEDNPGILAQTVDLPARPVLEIRGEAKWQGGYAAIQKSLVRIRTVLDGAKIKATGAPFAVFLATDGEGFRYVAMIPVESEGRNAPALGPDVAYGLSPAGKALKFEHRGSYDGIGAAYDQITAYLDEQGVEAKDMFIEEYRTPAQSPDDPRLTVDIYVFI